MEVETLGTVLSGTVGGISRRCSIVPLADSGTRQRQLLVQLLTFNLGKSVRNSKNKTPNVDPFQEDPDESSALIVLCSRGHMAKKITRLKGSWPIDVFVVSV